MGYNYTNTMVCWNPTNFPLAARDDGNEEPQGAIALIPWPDRIGFNHRFVMSAGACYFKNQKKSFEKRKLQVFIDAVHYIVRDGINPKKLHNIFLYLDEYRDGCSDDMPGLIRNTVGEEKIAINDSEIKPQELSGKIVIAK